MTAELRDYRIAPGHLDDFISAWRDGVVPLRERFGFRIEGAWAVRSESRFVWVLSHDGTDEQWNAVNEAYYVSSERAALDPDPAQWIQKAGHTVIQPVPTRSRP